MVFLGFFCDPFFVINGEIKTGFIEARGCELRYQREVEGGRGTFKVMGDLDWELLEEGFAR